MFVTDPRKLDRIRITTKRLRTNPAIAKHCGAGEAGAQGFQPGNSCASSGSGSGSTEEERKAWAAGLSEEQEISVIRWGNFFKTCQAIRALDVGTPIEKVLADIEKPDLGEYLTDLHKNFKSSIESAPPFAGTIWRTIRDVDASESFAVGSEFTNQAHSSATADHQITKYFATLGEPGKGIVTLQIKAKNAADISVVSLRGQREAVMRPGSQYKVTKHEQRTETDHDGKEYEVTYVHCEEL